MTDSVIIYLWVGCSIFICGLLFSSNVFSYIDGKDHDYSRERNLDGLRYILASMVVFHHSDYFINYFTINKWTTHSDFIYSIGKFGVAIFFSITAFLFWGKIRKSKSIDWINLYKDRFFRIVPMTYLSSFIAVSYIILMSTNHNNISLDDLLKWFDASVFDIKPNINGFNNSVLVLSGVTWTIKWEWGFYFSLPIIYFLRSKPLEASIGIMFVCMYFLPSFTDASYWYYSAFACGILSKELSCRISLSKKTSDLMLLASVTIFVLLNPSLNSTRPWIIVTVFMLCVAKGASLFGILNIKGFTRLGECSYSIYLLQGVVFYPSFAFIKDKYDINNLNISLPMITILFVALCVLSSLTFSFIERPLIKYGKGIKL
ncbi:acyltransferase family protein [Escherichia coli]